MRRGDDDGPVSGKRRRVEGVVGCFGEKKVAREPRAGLSGVCQEKAQ